MFAALTGAALAIKVQHTVQEVPVLLVRHVHSAEACDILNALAPRRGRQTIEYYFFD